MTAVEVFNVEISKLYYFLLSDIIIKRFCRIYNTTLLITNNRTNKSTTQQFNNTISTNSNKENDLQARSLIEIRLCYYKNLPGTRRHNIHGEGEIRTRGPAGRLISSTTV
ncbi:unnamed protein product [Acanthoscelides obtectus]|uniref:Uncharacterized protein n=1 Tax=Acanthoscelides obtectus TaxID=200917 RepID=A0A9P0P848_ACAOB|nr:unnamed protein product [Acanthoscelides obtectus]CAK1642586.1 hypothetical protein AOBTE_LOCUS13126 [Acanthoscelides obtectus]